MTFTPARLVGLVLTAVVVVVLGANFVAAVKPAVGREKKTLLDEACMPLSPSRGNAKLGGLPVPAPDIQAQDYTGKMVPLSAYRGKVVLLNFWAAWCPPCVEEMPSMDALQKQFGQDLVVMAVSSDPSWKEIREFFAATGTAMTILWDPAAADSAAKGGSQVGALSQFFGTEKLPESYLIDRDGNVRYLVVNTRNWASTEAQRCIRKLIQE